MDTKDIVNAVLTSLQESGARIMSRDEFDKWLADQNSTEATLLRKAEESIDIAYLKAWLKSNPKFPWTDEMREISGFGGSYELACRVMVSAGMYWFDEHPDGKPVHLESEQIIGVAIPEGDDAKSPEDYMLAPIKKNGSNRGNGSVLALAL